MPKFQAVKASAGAGRSDAELVLAARANDGSAYGELYQRWFDRCFDVAWNIVRDRETAADLAQDAFLVGWQRLEDLREPAAFGGWILRTTRNRALNSLERDRARRLEPIENQPEEVTALPDGDADPALLSERSDSRRLIWTAATALGERDSSLLDLHLRHGLDPSEIAEELRITPNNAHQLMFRLRSKLRDTIGAALLWREGRPTCQQLATLVPRATAFDHRTAVTIRRHQRTCTLCAGEVRRQTHPERLFAAVPIALAPLLLKQKAAAALVQAGIPLGHVAAGHGWLATVKGALAGHSGTHAVVRGGWRSTQLPAIGATALLVIGGVTAVGLNPLLPHSRTPARQAGSPAGPGLSRSSPVPTPTTSSPVPAPTGPVDTRQWAPTGIVVTRHATHKPVPATSPTSIPTSVSPTSVPSTPGGDGWTPAPPATSTVTITYYPNPWWPWWPPPPPGCWYYHHHHCHDDY